MLNVLLCNVCGRPATLQQAAERDDVSCSACRRPQWHVSTSHWVCY